MINLMLIQAIGGKTAHQGFMVLIRNNSTGQEVEQGPYSLPVAKMVAEEYSAFTTYIMDTETGELI
jgi:hypothetical protein